MLLIEHGSRLLPIPIELISPHMPRWKGVDLSEGLEVHTKNSQRRALFGNEELNVELVLNVLKMLCRMNPSLQEQNPLNNI